MKRAEAEVAAWDMHEKMMASLAKSGMNFVTEEDRERLGIPDIRERLMENVIEELMKVELSEEGQKLVDELLAKRKDES